MPISWLILLVAPIVSQTPQASTARELFDDVGFERGFRLSAASSLTANREIGVLRPAPAVENADSQGGQEGSKAIRTPGGPETRPPAWRLDQWATQFLLKPGMCQPVRDGWIAENTGKRVVLRRDENGLLRLLLEARGIPEYAGRLRKEGEAWPHLLIEQQFSAPIRFQVWRRITFTIETRIASCTADPALSAKLNPGLHTAQVSAFWTVVNDTKGNPDCGDMIWFGIPLFDARYDVPPQYCAIDSGKDDATGKFICLLDGKRFWEGRTGDGSWRKLDADLTSLIGEALATAKEYGHLKNTRLEDLALTTFNLGWEITGPYDAAMEIRGLSMLGNAE
jgi:hypothetical protein